MWQYRERINDLVTSFTSSIARYRLTCENLLGPLILPDAQRAQLLDEPNGEAWHDKDLGIQIEQRLGASYPAYIKLVSRLQKAILKFATKLGLDINNEYKVGEWSVMPVIATWLIEFSLHGLRTMGKSRSTLSIDSSRSLIGFGEV